MYTPIVPAHGAFTIEDVKNAILGKLDKTFKFGLSQFLQGYRGTIKRNRVAPCLRRHMDPVVGIAL